MSAICVAVLGAGGTIAPVTTARPLADGSSVSFPGLAREEPVAG